MKGPRASKIAAAIAGLPIAILVLAPVHSQEAGARAPFAPARVTAEDYGRAARFLSPGAPSLVRNSEVQPNWIGMSDRFWYRREATDGITFERIDARTRTRSPAFDHARLAEALSRGSGQEVTAKALP
ncbi:MAG: hypothetical protein ACREJC_17495, partial [Tepidisphaeraceae bacterium]